MLKSIVSGKSFFLGLDDLLRADVWMDLLRNPLQSEAVSSRVLVTTRDRSVAMQMGAVHTHNVEGLPVVGVSIGSNKLIKPTEPIGRFGYRREFSLARFHNLCRSVNEPKTLPLPLNLSSSLSETVSLM